MGIFKRNKKQELGARWNMGLGISGRPITPLRADEQETPEPERPTRLDEEARTAVHEMKEPPKAEG